MKRIKTIVLFCALSGLFGGCFKSVSYDTTYVVRPLVQLENQGQLESQPGVKVYAYEADTMEWTVASYADAVAGVVSSKFVPPQNLTPTIIAEAYASAGANTDSEDWLQMQITSPQMMVVAVDTEHQLYAYRNQTFAENLSPYYVTVVFRPWRSSYSEGGWRVVNEFFVGQEQKPVEPENPEQPTESAPSE